MSTSALATPHSETDATGHPRRRVALAVLMIAGFMDLLDTTIVNVALPAISNSLHTGSAATQWVAAGYTLTFAVGLITGGRLGDLFGRKRMFLLGMAAFTLFSLFCGIAWTAEVLVGARLLQGLSAAIMIPQVLSTMYATFPPSERAAAGGLFGGIAGFASVVGPLASGLLLEHDLWGLGWRAIFLVNVPVGVITLVLAAAVVPETRSSHAIKPDLRGMLLVSAALALVLVPLVQGRELGWPLWTFLSMAASLPVFALFIHSSRARGGSALVPMRLFRSRGFSAGTAVAALFFAAMAGFFLPYALTLQLGLGFTPMEAGLTSLPFSLGVVLSVVPSNTLVMRFGRYVTTVGALVMAAAVAVLIVRMDVGIGFWGLAPWLLLGGIGMGAVVGPIFAMAGAEIDGRDAGAASGTINAADQLGSSVGIAVLGVVFFNALGATPDVTSYIASFRSATWIAVGTLVVVALLSVMLPRRLTAEQLNQAH
ncbi:hypothetical protein ALI144C_28455 [Actinosynnema sp. ALI-1.44]|uniref:MFS transporter n=1 Tax=Actinosynnema sp. ALI-1.44 TaxID=1933779 RepID=UPI00097C8463|nr:MFS transporter [Actinosynnema sp. ALI-1.44]ONI78724.1 hypothetical protein ALI144C_28455 [Actinosynnema sp. ALI-1.44]